MSGHQKFPKIGGLHNVVKTVAHWAELSETQAAAMDYRAKIKLHGANMAVRISPGGDLAMQSRNQDIETGGHQFPQFVSANAGYFKRLADPVCDVIVYGEWAGLGVQRKVSVSKIPEKAFFVFALRFKSEESDILAFDPEHITARLQQPLPERLHVIPWFGQAVHVDFADTETLETLTDGFNRDVAGIDASDPYIKSLFGVDGPGEGLVYYPLAFPEPEDFGRYAFKVKGSRHEPAQGGEKKARTSTPVAGDVLAFNDMMVTPARVLQGMQELFGEGPYEKSGLGQLIKWVASDVQAEGQDELEASGLDWKQVAPDLPKRVRTLYFQQIETS